MTIRVNFGNSNNWNLVDSGSRNAVPNTTPTGQTAWLPILPINLPFLIESNTIACYLDTNNNNPKWFTGGFISFNVITGLTTGGNSNANILKKRIPLREISIIPCPKIAPILSLTISAPWYFKDISWVVWEYIGPGVADVQGKLDVLYDKLNN